MGIFTVSLGSVGIIALMVVLGLWMSSRLSARNTEMGAEILKSEEGEMPEIRMPAFSMVDQDNRAFSLDDLKGKVWIADFIFTTCTGPCPLLTMKMSQLQKELADPRIEFVSFSIDPETDTPAVLKAYGEKFSASARWHFLTGEDNAAYSIAKALKLPAAPASGNNPIFHTTKFTLIGPSGKVAGYYDYNDAADLNKLISDARRLAKS
jgi:protein SCO1/2